MLEYSIYSVISPRGCASILWKDASKEKEACEVLKITSEDMLKFGIAEAVIPEPVADLENIAENIKEYLLETLKKKSAKPIDVLLNERYTKFRKIGEFQWE